jgi:hypothetical protein
MAFEQYYRALARKGGRSTPSADDARKDYQAAMRRNLDGLTFVG